jgi:hypothetical protein
VLLALLAFQFRRYCHAQIYVFDKGFSARAAVLAMGGAHHALGLGGDHAGEARAIAFQPLRYIDRADERAWAAEWVGALLTHEHVAVTPEIKEALWSALNSLATAPVEERTLTGLSLLLQSTALRSALSPYTLEGPFGRLLDAAEDDFAMADIQCFETEPLMGQAGVVAPVLTYLFHRLDERFDGRPTLLVLDEAWIFLDHPLFAARIREWLKTLRKKNVAVLFATQSLADIADSSIAPAIIESCPQRILLPNDRAIEPQSRAAYERFGLNDRQIELVRLGEARAVTPAAADYRPTDPQIAWHLGRFITNIRGKSLDAVLMRENWLSAYDFVTRRGAIFLGEYARSAHPFADIGDRTVSVQVTSVVRASDTSFQVKWSESAFERGSLAGTSRWTAILTVAVKPPKNADTLRKNPLGLQVDAIDWSRELDTPATAPSARAPASAPLPLNLPLGSPLDPNLAAPVQPQQENPQ